jgi:hypothetical protein
MKDKNDAKTLDLVDSGQPPRGRGRPAVYSSPAERQKAYRARLKEQGKRVIQRVVTDTRDESKPLVSDVIDLSQIRGAKGV